MAGEERVKAEDLPTGDGDIVNNGDGNGVERKVNGVELVDEAVERGGILVREDGAAGAGGISVVFGSHVRSFPGLEMKRPPTLRRLGGSGFPNLISHYHRGASTLGIRFWKLLILREI